MTGRVSRVIVGLLALGLTPALACAPHETELRAARSASAFAASALVVASREELRAIRADAMRAAASCDAGDRDAVLLCQRLAVDRAFTAHAGAINRIEAMVAAQHAADDALAALDACRAHSRAAACAREVEQVAQSLPRVVRAIEALHRGGAL
jgi:hypothetical protein